MSRHEYATLPLHRASLSVNAELEMDRAFESDDEEDQHGEATPLNQINSSNEAASTRISTTSPAPPGVYDFERDYEYTVPAAASPSALPAAGPAVSATSTQNFATRIGNSFTTPSFIRRALGSILPTYYARVPTTEDAQTSRSHVRGGGMENDGVFANVMAKPSAPRTAQDENGNVYVMPEEAQKEAPPSYVEAQADAVPPYWETTVHAPHINPDEDMIVDGLPSGSYFSFMWNFLISISFQFVGFVLTYLLHTTHAAKFGSRAGLGITLIQYGLFSRGPQYKQEIIGADGNDGADEDESGMQRLMRKADISVLARDWFPLSSTTAINGTMDDSSNENMFMGTTARDWIAFLLMTIGWLLVLTSVLGFIRVKRWESSIRAAANPPPPPTAEELARDQQLRENLSRVFGFSLDDMEEGERATPMTSESSRPPIPFGRL